MNSPRIIKNTQVLFALAGALLMSGAARASDYLPETLKPSVIVDTSAEPMAKGAYEASWESLQRHEMPAWFEDAKFGIWAHWGPQCQPEAGDWYARGLYQEGGRQNLFHQGRYGHPSAFGFKDVINTWKAEKWDPEKLVALYKRVGAQYFFALANHHDNLDLWDSKYQCWNSVRVGPKKDLIAGWAKAAKHQGLRFGVSVHAAHAWNWYEVAQGADKQGAKAGVPYDGKLTKADGKGQWWEGLDPQELYEQKHAPSPGYDVHNRVHSQWNWGNGATPPDKAYSEKFYNRTVELINKYQPDLIYFDDTALPLWPVSDAGLKITAYFYNANASWHGGKSEAVVFGKILTEGQRKALAWDIERGAPNGIETPHWQTDTCIGGWHYERSVYEKKHYKSDAIVIRMLADIVSKNGNLLLNIPLRGDGSLDDREEAILEGIASWMAVNKEAIFGTRPWVVFGEGPASEGAPMQAQGFNEGKGRPFGPEDIRFTVKGDDLYAIVLGVPEKALAIHNLGKAAGKLSKQVSGITLLGSAEPVVYRQAAEALVIEPAKQTPANKQALVYRIRLK